MSKTLSIALVLLLTASSTALLAHGSGTPSLALQWSKSLYPDGEAIVAVTDNGSYVAVGLATQASTGRVLVYDAGGNELGSITTSFPPRNISISFDGFRAVVSDNSQLYVVDYNSSSGSYYLAKTISVTGDIIHSVLPRYDYSIVVYVEDYQGISYTLHVYNLGTESEATAPIETSGTVTCLAAADTLSYDGYLYIVVGDSSGTIRVYKYSEASGVVLVDEKYLGTSTSIVSVDTTLRGRVVAVFYRSLGTGDSYVAVYALNDQSLVQVGDSVLVGLKQGTVRLQSHDDTDTYYLVAGSGDIYVLKANTTSNTLEVVATTGDYYADETLVDISFYGSYAAGGSGDSTAYVYLLDTSTQASDTGRIDYQTGLDLSEDARVLVVGDSSGNIYYYYTGVEEDLPIPIPEHPLVALAAATLVLVALTLRNRRMASQG